MWNKSILSEGTVNRNHLRSNWQSLNKIIRIPIIVMPAPALPIWHSRALEGARMPCITHSCHHHYAHLPSLVTRISELMDSPGLNHLFYYLPYICLFPLSVPRFSINCLTSVYYLVLTLFLSCSMSVPIKCWLPVPASLLQRWSLHLLSFHPFLSFIDHYSKGLFKID